MALAGDRFPSVTNAREADVTMPGIARNGSLNGGVDGEPPPPPLPVVVQPQPQPREGSLIKAQTTPEIYLIDGGNRRWIPDPATLLSRWSWDQVQTVPDLVAALIPLGDPYPSVIQPIVRPDGTLLQASTGEIYVMQGGMRRWIPNWSTFVANGYRPSDVQVISDPELNAIPLGIPLPLVPRLFADSGWVDLGSNKHMQTRAGLLTESGHLDASTRTQTGTWFGGYHGGVYIILGDADNIAIGESSMHRFGVDGTWIGQSDRTDAWSEDFDPAVTRRTISMTVFQTWAPDDFLTTLGRIRDIVGSVAGIVQQAAPIAKAITSVTG